jgi:hypothetical protein
LKFTVSATSIALGQSVAFTLTADDPSGLRSMGVVDKSNNDLAVTPTPWPFPPSSPTSETRTWTPSSEGTYPIRAWVRDNSAARNEASATATITVLAAPPPQPSPDPIYTVSTLAPTSCTFVVNASAKPPALTGVNIGVQFQRSPDQATWTNHGSRDNAAPYERSASLANRTWFFRAIWSSSTTTLPAVTAGRKDGCAP